MESLKVFDGSNAFIASYFTDDKGCAHCNREHTLIYLISGELEITDRRRKVILSPGDCAFMRRDNQMWLQKRIKNGQPYHSIVLKYSRDFLRNFYNSLKKEDLPIGQMRNSDSLYVMPADKLEFQSLFASIIPYFDAQSKPSDEILKLKMCEGLYAILNADSSLYASLFDFVEPWKIDILDFLEKNFTSDLTMEEIAYYTGRSLSTFKRDFKKYSNISPQKWLIRRRLAAAHELIRIGGRKISDICFDVGFRNLSHFSKVYKELYGFAPTADI